MLERTTSERRPPSELATASGKLKARNSVSASGRSIRNGSTMSRVTWSAHLDPEEGGVEGERTFSAADFTSGGGAVSSARLSSRSSCATSSAVWNR
jgi:hypothetical protein